MKCERHSDFDAVGQCTDCGVGVCAKCAEITKPLSKYGMKCVKCAKGYYEQAIENVRKETKKLLTQNIISIILYILGAIVIIASLLSPNADSMYMIICGIVCCGVFTGITGWKTMKQTNDDFDAKYGAEYIVDETGIHKNTHWISKLIFFVLGTVLGVVVTPIRVIINFIRIKNNKIDINDLYEDIQILEYV